jgi:hypothetical protein
MNNKQPNDSGSPIAASGGSGGKILILDFGSQYGQPVPAIDYS